ncbi:MAG: hypothetical protein RBR97_01105 [Bacteroidales bacterium]|nr:hypothetical protein [Bacteroidales bacterium]
MNKILKNLKLGKELFVISLFFASYIVYNLFSAPVFLLNDTSTLYISQATLDGVDVSARVNLFYKALLSVLFLIPIIYLLLFGIKKKFKISKKQLTLPMIIAFTGFSFIVFDVFRIVSLQSIHLLFAVFILSLLVLTLAQYNRQLRFIQTPSFYSLVFLLSGLLFVAVLFLFNSNSFINSHLAWIYFLIFILIIFGFLIIKKFTGYSINKIAAIGVAFTLIPIFIFVSTELLFLVKLKLDFYIPYKWVFMGLVFVSFLIIGFLVWKSKLKISRNRLNLFYSLSFLLSFLLLKLYSPIQEHPTEMFELANPANALMRIFKFHEIPFVDFMSSHMFSEQYYGIIHSLIFGYDGSLDFFSYSFFNKVIFYVVAFFFLNKVLQNRTLSVLFLLTFPFISVLFCASIFLGIIVFFSINKLINNQTIKNYLVFCFLLILMIFWSIDTGYSSLVTAVFFLPLMFFVENKKPNYKNLFKTLLVFLIVVAGLFITFSVIRSPQYLLDSFTSALHYLKANQAHGYSEISTEYSHQFYLLHVLLPLISVISVLYIIFILRIQRESEITNKRFLLKSSLFLFILFLVNFQRGIVRHGFIEGQDTFLTCTFYIALAIFLLSFCKKKNLSFRYVFLFEISFLLIVLVKYFPLYQGKSDMEMCFTESSLVKLDSTFCSDKFQSKILGDKEFAEKNYAEIKTFLDQNLSSEQTFLDFSNTPMLYYYCQRNVPSYFCQSLQNVVDDYLQIKNIENIDVKEVPVVVYSNYPLNWFDMTDGVLNAMRQYIIVEFIYRNYEPFRVINNHSIWVSKEFSPSFSDTVHQMDALVIEPKTYDYRKSAGIINDFFKKSEYSDLQLLGKGEIIPDKYDGSVTYSIDKKTGCGIPVFVKIYVNEPVDGEVINVVITNDECYIGTVLFTIEKNRYEYMLMLSNHYLWYVCKPTYLNIKLDSETEIKMVEFYQDKRYEY